MQYVTALAAQRGITGAKPAASPSLRARNLRMREWSQSSSGNASASSLHSASSSSLASINSARNGNADHFRMAGRSILGSNQNSHRFGASPINASSARASPQNQGNNIFLSPNNAAGNQSPAASSHSLSSVSNHHGGRSGSASSQGSADLARIYSNSGKSSHHRMQSANFNSSDSDRPASQGSNGARHHIHLSNVDLSSSEDDIRPNSAAQEVAANSVIRIEMQPKRQIRANEDTSKKVRGGKTQVLLSKQASQVCSDTTVALQTLRAGSSALKALEQTHLFSEGLLMRDVTEEGQKKNLLDLDDEEGVEVCKTYLSSIERLMCSLGLVLSSRTYRNEFSNSYKVLYKQMQDQYGSKAAYLPEILDSAQEGFDHLWVNGEKYVFSDHVVESGDELFKHFCDLKDFASIFFQRHFENDQVIHEESLPHDFRALKEALVKFDELWTCYEQKYVYELMVIEGDARRFIIESINAETLLSQDHMQLATFKDQATEKRKLILENISQVNAVANVEGKGRDDFEYDLLERAEGLMQTEKKAMYSRAVAKLAKDVSGTFEAFRALIREYQANIELVDPQLKNNEPLVKVVSEFENAWCIAQNQIGSEQHLQHLDSFSKLLQETQNELPLFKEQVECRDAQIFMSIPALLVMETLLKKLGSPEQEFWHGLCVRFKEGITTQEEWKQTQRQLKSLESAKMLLESLRLQVLELQTSPSHELQSETNSVKHLGMELQRSEPMAWNEFMTACIVDE